jgi:hypothetical protein
MKPVQPTTIINVDDTAFDVAKMSPEVQQMIAYYDDWRQREVDLTSDLLMARNALKSIQGELLEKIQAERAEALKKAEALGIIPSATEPSTSTTEE